jgi:hypothetical protein
MLDEDVNHSDGVLHHQVEEPDSPKGSVKCLPFTFHVLIYTQEGEDAEVLLLQCVLCGRKGIASVDRPYRIPLDWKDL